MKYNKLKLYIIEPIFESAYPVPPKHPNLYPSIKMELCTIGWKSGSIYKASMLASS